MNLHNLCLDSLNHSVTQALTCGSRLSYGTPKDLLLTFGALHLFVVSGAHLTGIRKALRSFGLSKKTEHVFILIFILSCNFSAPLIRTYTQSLLHKKTLILYVPGVLSPAISYLLCFPLSYYLNGSLSLSLSLLFGTVISLLPKNFWSYVLIYVLALPVFAFTLGLPHYSSLFLLPLITGFIFILLPFSFISLFSDYLEAFTIKTWWLLESSLEFLAIFYDFPLKPRANFTSLTNLSLTAYSFLLIITSYLLGVSWKRSSYSF